MKALTLRTDEKTWAKVKHHFDAYSNQEAFDKMLTIIKAHIATREAHDLIQARINAKREKDLQKLLKKKANIKKSREVMKRIKSKNAKKALEEAFDAIRNFRSGDSQS
jgi:TRAP-type mannitol/chloroaromatic compound transport system substrate-binding protein